MYGSVEIGKDPEGRVTMRVMKCVDLKMGGGDGREVTMEWTGGSTNDMIADSVLALLMGIDTSPASVKSKRFALVTSSLAYNSCAPHQQKHRFIRITITLIKKKITNWNLHRIQTLRVIWTDSSPFYIRISGPLNSCHLRTSMWKLEVQMNNRTDCKKMKRKLSQRLQCHQERCQTDRTMPNRRRTDTIRQQSLHRLINRNHQARCSASVWTTMWQTLSFRT